jgi:hypothetical protein
MQSGVYTIYVSQTPVLTYCHVVGTDAWTLMMMKIDGSKNNFAYDSTYWSTNATLVWFAD